MMRYYYSFDCNRRSLFIDGVMDKTIDAKSVSRYTHAWVDFGITQRVLADAYERSVGDVTISAL